MPYESEFTRRAVVAGSGMLVAATALTACSGNGTQGGAPVPQAPATAAGERLAATSAVPVGGGTVFAEKEVVVTQPTQGTFKAFSATCTHQGCTVNRVAGGTINCPCHGSKFAIADGSVVNGPAQRPLEARQVTVSGGDLLLES